MYIFILFLLYSSLLWSAIDRNPPNCSSRPCTYTLTCAAAQCTSSESAELQTVFDEAWLGDTIILQAGRTWDASSSRYVITGRPGSTSDWLTIRTSEIDKIPPENTRVTLHHASAMPVIRAPTGVNIAVKLLGGTNPAKNIRWIGIYFTSGGTSTSLIDVGGSASSITDESHLPDNIEFLRVINRRTQWTNVSFGQSFMVKAKRLKIQDSFLQGSYDPDGKEKQNIAITMCLDCKILNNALFDTAGENLFFGGTGRPYNSDPTSSGEVAYNAIFNHKERIPTKAWEANAYYFQDVRVQYNGLWYRATASCIEGGTFGSGCSWVQVSDRRHMKNNFEIKDAYGLKIHHNLFDGFWLCGGGADQYENVVFKASTCRVSSGTYCQGVGPHNGTCNTNGTVVTSSNPLPSVFHCNPGGASEGSVCNVITINGVDYNIANFNIDNPYQITLTSSAGVQNNVPYTFGRQNDTSSWNLENNFENNVVRNGPQPWQQVQVNGAHTYHIGRYRVRNNLFYRMSCNEFAQATCGCGSWSNNSRSMLLFGGVPYGLIFENNTFVDMADYTYTANWHGNFACRGVPRGTGNCPSGHAPTAGDTIFRNNIIARGSNTAALTGESPTVVGDANVIANKVCEGGCAPHQWSGNIIAGASLAGFPSGTYNLCPSASSCTPNFEYDDPVYGKLFVDYANRNYQINPSHYAARGGYGPSQIGADWSSLPIMTKISNGGIGIDVSTTPTSATLSWRVTPPMKHLNCTVHISQNDASHEGADMEYPIPQLDALTNGYTASMAVETGPLTRSFTVSGLTPGKRYWTEVHCGSVERLSFVTQ